VGQICRARGWTMCKGSRAGHDRRSDVPTVGCHTIRRLHENGGRCLALAAGDVIMIDRREMIELADSLGVAIIGVTPSKSGTLPASATEVKGTIAVPPKTGAVEAVEEEIIEAVEMIESPSGDRVSAAGRS
jgi:hypothetical protein